MKKDKNDTEILASKGFTPESFVGTPVAGWHCSCGCLSSPDGIVSAVEPSEVFDDGLQCRITTSHGRWSCEGVEIALSLADQIKAPT